MAGAKKKKKPAANPARGFATTSIASKPRPEIVEVDPKPSSTSQNAPPTSQDKAPPSDSKVGDTKAACKETPLSAEEFERQLEESQLQLLVERISQKTKRDAQRQRSRLETDRRLLRSQADSVNSIKWLPQDLMDYILDLIKAEHRFAASSLSSDNAGAGKIPPEEDLIARLWTLQQTLLATDFPKDRVQAVMKYILDITPNIPSVVKDSIWGLDEAFDWLARECPSEELPTYEPKGKPVPKSTGQSSLPIRQRLVY